MLLNIKTDHLLSCPHCQCILANTSTYMTNKNTDSELFHNISELNGDDICFYNDFISAAFILKGICYNCGKEYFSFQNNFIRSKTKKALSLISLSEDENINHYKNYLFYNSINNTIETVCTYNTESGMLYSFLSQLLPEEEKIKDEYEEYILDKLKYINKFQSHTILADLISNSLFSKDDREQILFPIDNIFIQIDENEDIEEISIKSETYFSILNYIFSNSKDIIHYKSNDPQFFYHTFEINYNNINNLLSDDSFLKNKNISELYIHIPYLKNKKYEHQILHDFKSAISKINPGKSNEVNPVDYKEAEIYFDQYIKKSNIIGEIDGYYIYHFNEMFFYLNDDWKIAIECI